MKLEISTLTHLFDQFPKAFETDFESLSKLLRQRPKTEKLPPSPQTGKPLSPEERGLIDDAYLRAKQSQSVWSPAKYAPKARRAKENVISCPVMTIDLDGVDDETVTTIKTTLDHFLAFGATSFNHRGYLKQGKACWRFVICLDEPVSGDDWERFWRVFNDNIVDGKNDPATKDSSRVYFYGSVPEDTADLFETWVSTGTAPFPVQGLLAQCPESHSRALVRVHHEEDIPRPPPPAEDSIEYAIALEFARTTPVAVSKSAGGQGRRLTNFQTALALVKGMCLSDDQAFELMRDEYNPRCQPPDTEERLWSVIHEVNAGSRIKAHWGYLRPGNASETPQAAAYSEAYYRTTEAEFRKAAQALNAGRALQLAPQLQQLKAGRPVAFGALMVDPATKSLRINATLNQTINHFSKVAKAAPKPPAPVTDLDTEDEDGKPIVWVEADSAAVAERCREILPTVPNLYVRNGALVQVLNGELTDLPSSLIKEVLSSAAVWQRPSQDGPVRCRPDNDVVEALKDRRHFPGVPESRSRTLAPRFDDEGRVFTKAGYHPSLQVILGTDWSQLPLKDEPTQDDARIARETLESLVSDFPFQSDVDRSIWIASILTQFVKPKLVRLSPVFLLDSSLPDSGKSTLARLSIRIGQGIKGPIENESISGAADKRLRELLAKASTGKEYMFLDEVGNYFGNSDFDALVTSGTVTGQPLYSKATVTYQYNPVIIATGRRVEMDSSTGRRVLRIALENRFKQKTNFKIQGSIDAYVSVNLDTYMTAAITMLQAFLAANRTEPNTELSSFPDWGRVVAGTIIFAGGQNPLATNAERLADFAIRDPASEMLEFWAEHIPGFVDGVEFSASEIITKTTSKGGNVGLVGTSLLKQFTNTSNNDAVSASRVFRTMNKCLGMPVQTEDGHQRRLRRARRTGRKGYLYFLEAEPTNAAEPPRRQDAGE